MPTSHEYWDAFAPRWSSVADPTKDLFLGMAATRMSSTAFGDLYAEAAVWLALHLYACGPGAESDGAGAGAAGPVTREKTGDLEVAYGSASSSNRSGNEVRLSETRFGRRFLEIRDGLVLGPVLLDGINASGVS